MYNLFVNCGHLTSMINIWNIVLNWHDMQASFCMNSQKCGLLESFHCFDTYHFFCPTFVEQSTFLPGNWKLDSGYCQLVGDITVSLLLKPHFRCESWLFFESIEPTCNAFCYFAHFPGYFYSVFVLWITHFVPKQMAM